MSHPAQGTSLSLSARLLCYLGPPSVVLLTAIASPRTALLSPFTFIPTIWCFWTWRKTSNNDVSRRGELEVMIWTYTAIGTIGLPVVGLVQTAICSAVSRVLFRSSETWLYFWDEFGRSTTQGLTAEELARRADLAVSWQNWVFNGFLTFVAAGLVEETLKYIPIAYARRRGTVQQRQHRRRAYIDYSIAGALSFSLIEGIGFLFAACEQAHEAWPKLMVTLSERVVAGSLGHLLAASLTALRSIRRDYYGDRMSWWVVIGPSVILHGTYNFIAMTASALEGNVGWIHPSGVRVTTAMCGLISAVLAIGAWQVRREWKTLEDRDRSRK